MAYAIPRSKIAPTQLDVINRMLCLKPEGINTKYTKGKQPAPIHFHLTENGVVHLPYLFASSLFQVIPNIDIPYPHVPLAFTGALRPQQVTVEEEAWKQLEQRGTTTLGLYPGFGKTILGMKLASRAKLLTVILVHRELLTTQWKKTCQEFTNGVVWIVGEKNPPSSCDIIICMDTRWHHIPSAIRDAVGFMIIDEAHAFCTPTHVSCLLAFHPKYIVAESASLLRDDGLHSMIYAICGNHGVFREVGKPFNVMKITTNVKPVRKMNRFGGVDWSSLVSATLNDERRNKIIVDLVIANRDRKILILTSQVNHALQLNQNLITAGIGSDCLCSTKKNYVDAAVLVGTVSKIGTGFDQASFCATYNGVPFDLLILVCSLKKYAMLTQNVGRCFRSDNPVVMHLVDDDDIYRSHWSKAQRWYRMHEGTITHHDIPDPNVVKHEKVEFDSATFLRRRCQDLLIQRQIAEAARNS